MKYVMFTHPKTGIKAPVFSADHICHESLRADPDWVATSAGFYDAQQQRCYGESTSLHLEPEDGDDELCMLVFAGYEAMLIVSQDLDRNLVRLQDLRRRQEEQAKRERKVSCKLRNRQKGGSFVN